MTKRPRGQCLIVNNEVFDHMKERRGSSADAANLNYLFTDLGFEVTVKPNLAEIDVKRQVRQFAQSEAHSKVRKNFFQIFNFVRVKNIPPVREDPPKRSRNSLMAGVVPTIQENMSGNDRITI